MKARLLSIAAAELTEAIAQYHAIDPNLARRFVREIEGALARVTANPSAWAPIGAGLRRCQAKHFPYGIIYTVEDGEVLVVAVPHLHRDPAHWRDRVRG